MRSRSSASDRPRSPPSAARRSCERFAVFHAAIGSDAREATDRATVEETVASTLAAQRDAVSGVSLDEEFTDLIRYQRGFQAASQLIAVSNTLLDDLLALVSG